MQGSISQVITGGGLTLGSGVVAVEADTPNPISLSVPAAKAGVLTTRTDANTGVVTVQSGHGITDADTVDLYDGNGQLIRHGMDVTATTSTTITIDVGTGEDLPTQGSAVRITKPTLVSPILIDASGIKLFAIGIEAPGETSQGFALFESSAPATVASFEMTANKAIPAHVEAGADNPFSGDAASLKVSNGSATFAAVLKVISMEDRTP